ncbi:MAG: hypothetical protein ISR69_02145 [Gammaproteobacteria bacterium]|nr:hypothetical protein [Gammaproteobacteria bacterium]
MSNQETKDEEVDAILNSTDSAAPISIEDDAIAQMLAETEGVVEDDLPSENHKEEAKENEAVIADEVEVFRWTLPEMIVDPNNVVRFEEDEETLKRKQRHQQQLKKDEVEEEQEVEVKPLEPTAEQIEAWKAEIREEIFQQAHSEGHQQGLEQAKQETDLLKQQLNSMMTSLESPLSMMNHEVEQQLELLAVTLAQQLVRRELKSNPGEIVGVIRESIKLLPASSRKIKITINPEDSALVKDALSLTEHDEDLKWTFIDDPMITRGGCIIKSDKSVINATLENRLASLAVTVLSAERMVDNAPDSELETTRSTEQTNEAKSNETSIDEASTDYSVEQNTDTVTQAEATIDESTQKVSDE